MYPGILQIHQELQRRTPCGAAEGRFRPVVVEDASSGAVQQRQESVRRTEVEAGGHGEGVDSVLLQHRPDRFHFLPGARNRHLVAVARIELLATSTNGSIVTGRP